MNEDLTVSNPESLESSPDIALMVSAADASLTLQELNSLTTEELENLTMNFFDGTMPPLNNYDPMAPIKPTVQSATSQTNNFNSTMPPLNNYNPLAPISENSGGGYDYGTTAASAEHSPDEFMTMSFDIMKIAGEKYNSEYTVYDLQKNIVTKFISGEISTDDYAKIRGMWPDFYKLHDESGRPDKQKLIESLPKDRVEAQALLPNLKIPEE